MKRKDREFLVALSRATKTDILKLCFSLDNLQRRGTEEIRLLGDALTRLADELERMNRDK